MRKWKMNETLTRVCASWSGKQIHQPALDLRAVEFAATPTKIG